MTLLRKTFWQVLESLSPAHTGPVGSHRQGSRGQQEAAGSSGAQVEAGRSQRAALCVQPPSGPRTAS